MLRSLVGSEMCIRDSSDIEPVLHVSRGPSPIPGHSQYTGTRRTKISCDQEIKGTAALGRHAFSARHPSPDRQPQCIRSNTAHNSPASNSDFGSWQDLRVSESFSRTQGPNGLVTNRELSVTGSSVSVNDTGNSVSLHDRRQRVDHPVASTSQAGASTKSSPIPSTSRQFWRPRTTWNGSPWSNAGVPVTPGRGYRTTVTRWSTPGFSGSISGPGIVTRADISTPPPSQVTESGRYQNLWHHSSRSNRFVDEGTQTEERDIIQHDVEHHSSVRSVTSAQSFNQSVSRTAPVYQFDSFPHWNE